MYLRAVIDSFSYCGLVGVDMTNPEVEFVIFEDCESAISCLPRALRLIAIDDEFACHTLDHRLERDGKFKRVYFGHRVSQLAEKVEVPGLTA